MLGLGLDGAVSQATVEGAARDLPESIAALVADRADARERRDFATSDDLRDQLSELGYDVVDRPSGQEVRGR